jgi:hypothetical protein
MGNSFLDEARTQAQAASARLRSAIKERGLSLREIDRRLDFTEGQTSNKLAGRRGLDLAQFLAIAKAGGVEIAEVLPCGGARGSLLANLTPQDRLELQEFIRETVGLAPGGPPRRVPTPKSGS